MKEQKKGGKRPASGRKPLADEKKEAVTIYIKKSSIKRHGGKIVLKEILTRIAESDSIDGIKLGDDAFVTAPSQKPMTLIQKDREKKQILKAVNPPLTEEFKKTFPPQEAKSAHDINEEEIYKKIAFIRAEKIPKDRDTVMGRKSWEMDQRKRIEELQSKL